MNILITGSSGFIGTHSISFFENLGFHVFCLLRHQKKITAPSNNSIFFNEEQKTFDSPEIIKKIDIIIHLAGANIAEHRWTTKQKKILFSSRIDFTRNLFHAFKKLSASPKLLISASGVGIYESKIKNEIVDESSSLGNSFLSHLAKSWENEVQKFHEINTKVCILRFGSVLSSEGGLLQKILPIYKLFLGGPFGKGNQIMPWISLEDLLNIMKWIIFKKDNKEIQFYNAVAPEFISNQKFTDLLAKMTNKTNFLRIPTFIIKVILGEMGKELLLSNLCVYPKNLLNENYKFIYPNLENYLKEKISLPQS